MPARLDADRSESPQSISVEDAVWALASVASLCLVAVALFNTTAEPDLWGHVRFGRDIVSSGSIARVDPYSFTSDRAWVNHEWLAESIMYLAYRIAGSGGLVALKLVLLLGTVAALVRSLVLDHLKAHARHLLLLAAVSSMFLRVQAVRPQLFSFLLFAWLLVIVRETDEGRPRALVAAPLLVGVWVNVHGGWIVGLAVWLAWCAWNAVDPQVPARRRASIAAAGLAAVLATLLNPYGFELWQFLWETVGLSRADIRDWQPVYLVSAGVFVPWAALTAATAASLVWSTRPRRIAYVAVVAVLAVGTFRVSRLDAFFDIAVVSLLGPQLADLGRRGLQWFGGEAGTPAPMGRRAGVWFITGVSAVVVGAAAMLSVPALGCIRMQGDWLPEQEAGLFLQSNLVDGRMMTWFGWGEYAIWFGGPGLRVSLDGRRETVYSAGTVAEQLAFARGDTSTRELPERYRADWVWLPKGTAPLQFLQEAGWRVAFSGPASVMLARAEGPAWVATPGGPGGPTRRCFPGP